MCLCESATDVMVTLDFSMFPSRDRWKACGWPALGKGAQRAAKGEPRRDPEYVARAPARPCDPGFTGQFFPGTFSDGT